MNYSTIIALGLGGLSAYLYYDQIPKVLNKDGDCGLSPAENWSYWNPEISNSVRDLTTWNFTFVDYAHFDLSADNTIPFITPLYPITSISMSFRGQGVYGGALPRNGVPLNGRPIICNVKIKANSFNYTGNDWLRTTIACMLLPRTVTKPPEELTNDDVYYAEFDVWDSMFCLSQVNLNTGLLIDSPAVKEQVGRLRQLTVGEWRTYSFDLTDAIKQMYGDYIINDRLLQVGVVTEFNKPTTVCSYSVDVDDFWLIK